MFPIVEFIHKRRALLLGGLGLLLAGVAVFFWKDRFSRRNPLLDTPQLALASLQAKSLYYNARARPWLVSLRPDLLTAEDRDADSERSRMSEQSVQSPKLFWQLERRYRFDALLLVGDPSWKYQPPAR